MDMGEFSFAADAGDALTLWGGLREVLGLYQDVCGRFYSNWPVYSARAQRREAYRKREGGN